MKKNKSKKTKAGKKSLLDGATKSLKKLTKGSAFTKLTTTQKVLGGAALLAVGLGYLGKRRTSTPAAAGPDATAAEESLASMEGGAI